MIKLSEEYLLQKENNDNAFVFNIKTGAVYKINETVFDFLSLCDGTKQFEEIASILAADYQVQLAEVMSDFGPLLVSWRELGLIYESVAD